MKSLKIKQASYSAELFLPDTEPSSTYLYAAGFPYSIGKNSAISWLCSMGVAVFFPQAPGTYDSDGKFCPSSHAELLLRAATDINSNALTNARTGGALEGSVPAVRGIVAHSYGTIAALDFVKAYESVEVAILFAPILGYCKDHYGYGVREDLGEQISYVQRTRPHTFRLASRQVILEQSMRCARDISDSRTFRNAFDIVGVVGDKDSTFDVEILSRHWESFITERIAGPVRTSLIRNENGGHSIGSILSADVDSVIKPIIIGA
ncbi:hypothetical protein IRT45_05865 [Nocardia sp. BSTN01]|uniref:hypothetical protein n=1 Tax=Nocardia sp. BSTN01 TaxID=2783665 RepID=UPI00188EA2C6|nr:hypothetical protein [Nocardia sp. BSTN01]MBF4996680.1 hypothetical protein [Nocardia sp. BSTN01]